MGRPGYAERSVDLFKLAGFDHAWAWTALLANQHSGVA
jgi:3,4-dihydroxy-2-butanone 4-phosphate synthase